MRLKSYIKGSCFLGRACEEMVAGETRELTIVTLDQESRNRDGTISILRFMCTAQPSVDDPTVAATPTPIEEPPTSMYGLSLVPLLLVDRHTSKPKKKALTHNGFPLLFFGSIDVAVQTKTAPCGRQFPTELELCHSHGTLEFREWVLEVNPLSKCPSSSFMAEHVSKATYEFESAKMRSRLAAHLQRQQDHPTVDELGTQTASSYSEVVQLSQLFAECTSAGFVLDLLASTTVDSCHLPFFTDPCGFPLYISVCVVLAATPSLLHCAGASYSFNDEDAATTSLFAAYRSMTPGNTTILETLVQLVAEQLMASQRQGTRSMPAPVSTTHMRRQGLTVCHELCAPLHQDQLSYFNGIESEFCGAENYRNALGVLTPSCIERTTFEKRASGLFGSTRQEATYGTRCSTRCTRLRRLLQLMVDVNELLESGIYRMRREYAENTGEAAIRHSNINSQTSLLNVEAWETAFNTVKAYLVQGPFALLSGAGFAVFPIRRRTRATCGACKEKFSFCTTATKSRIAHCPVCSAFYCNSCYTLKVEGIRKGTGTDFVSLHQTVEYRHALVCHSCSSKRSLVAAN